MTVNGHSEPIFGHALRKHFFFPDGYRNMNHGSFGTYPKPVRDTFLHYSLESEVRPDKFIRYTYKDLLLSSRKAVARLLNVDTDNCVFVANATTGVNTALRNLVYKAGDVIIYTPTIYGACEKTIASIIETTPGLKARKLKFTLPCEHEDIIDALHNTVKELIADGLNPRIAIFDTVCSMPGYRFPFERFTEECKKLQILSLIDAAHGIGQIKLDLAAFDPDFFVSNCHKWLFTPRSCAVFYVPERNHHYLRTTYPTSHGYLPLADSEFASIGSPLPASDSKAFPKLFEFVATVDNSPYYCVPAAMKFREEVCGGEEAIYSYLADLNRKGTDLLAKAWQTEILTDKKDKMRECAMANVRVPIKIGTEEGCISPEKLSDYRAWLEKIFVEEYDTYIQFYIYQGQIWTRVSAQVYLELEDYEWMAKLVKEVLLRNWEKA